MTAREEFVRAYIGALGFSPIRVYGTPEGDRSVIVTTARGIRGADDLHATRWCATERTAKLIVDHCHAAIKATSALARQIRKKLAFTKLHKSRSPSAVQCEHRGGGMFTARHPLQQVTSSALEP